MLAFKVAGISPQELVVVRCEVGGFFLPRTRVNKGKNKSRAAFLGGGKVATRLNDEIVILESIPCIYCKCVIFVSNVNNPLRCPAANSEAVLVN